MPSPAAEAVHLPSIPFGRTTAARLTGEGRRLGTIRWRWAQVDEAVRSDRGTDPLVDHPDDVHDAVALADTGLDTVSRTNRGRRLGGSPVDPDVSGPGGIGGRGSGREQAHRPQPPIHPRLVDVTSSHLDEGGNVVGAAGPHAVVSARAR